MIETYFIEDLSLADLDKLIERGVCFDVASKNTLLPESGGYSKGDNIRGSGSQLSRNLHDTT